LRCAIAAIVSIGEAAPVERCEVAALAAAARLPGNPPLGRVWTDGVAGLSCRPIVGSAESADLQRGSIPRRGGGQREVHEVIFDGTLDNRRELQEALGQPPACSDAALVAQAYLRWGPECAAELIGEFAFVLWDAQEGRLVAARDVFGCRELFFSRRGDRLRVGSQLWQVAPASLSDSDIDTEYVANFLASLEAGGHRTPFQNLERLPAGHVLIVERGAVRQERYWTFSRTEGVSAGPDEAVELFRSLFTESVGRALQTGHRVWAELSGGLDSSSIVCVAAERIRSRPELYPELTALSLVWDDTAQCDERRWSRPVADQTGVSCHWLRCDDLFFDDSDVGAYFRNEPHFGLLCSPMLRQEADWLLAHGVDALLSGARAESVVFDEDEPPVHLVELLRHFRLRQLKTDLLAWQEALQRPLLNLILDYCLRPLVRPRSYLRASCSESLEPWIDPGFARRLGLMERRSTKQATRLSHDPVIQHQFERLARSEQRMNRGYIEWACELRHPYLYRPLVEAVLAMPWASKARPGTDKPLLRDAMRGVLPEEVRTRRGKRGPGPAAYKAFALRWQQLEPLFDDPLLASLGFVDAAALRQQAELVRFGAATNFGSFTTCLAMEIWYRTALHPAAAEARATSFD